MSSTWVLADQTLCIMQGGWTALMLAANNGHTNVVEILLQHKPNVDMQNEVSTGSLLSH